MEKGRQWDWPKLFSCCLGEVGETLLDCATKWSDKCCTCVFEMFVIILAIIVLLIVITMIMVRVGVTFKTHVWTSSFTMVDQLIPCLKVTVVDNKIWEVFLTKLIIFSMATEPLVASESLKHVERCEITRSTNWNL